MRILIFYQYFSTPKGSWGTRIYEFAKDWVKAGHEVTVVSSIYVKSDLQASRLLETQYIDGIQVRVINVKIDNKQPIPKRIASFLTYAMMASWYALTLKTDLVISSSGPITVGLPGLLAKWFRGRKMIFEARDLWPEGAIELGIIKNPIIKKIAYAFERACYRNARLVVGLSPGMKRYIEEKHRHPNVISITNSANLQLFGTPHTANLETLGIEPHRYAIYTGNIGMVNNSYWLFHAAECLQKRGRNDIKILLVGEGQQREELCQLAQEKKLETFVWQGLMPKENLVALIQSAIVSLVPLKGTPVLDTSSPNKFFESLAAGVPVIQNTQGWMKDYLEENKVGYTLPPNDPDALADLVIRLCDHPEELEEMRQNARRAAERDFDQNKLSKVYLKSLLEISNA